MAAKKDYLRGHTGLPYKGPEFDTRVGINICRVYIYFSRDFGYNWKLSMCVSMPPVIKSFPSIALKKRITLCSGRPIRKYILLFTNLDNFTNYVKFT